MNTHFYVHYHMISKHKRFVFIDEHISYILTLTWVLSFWIKSIHPKLLNPIVKISVTNLFNLVVAILLHIQVHSQNFWTVNARACWICTCIRVTISITRSIMWLRLRLNNSQNTKDVAEQTLYIITASRVKCESYPWYSRLAWIFKTLYL